LPIVNKIKNQFFVGDGNLKSVSKLDFEYTYNAAGRLVNVRETLGTGANAVRNLAYQYNTDGFPSKRSFVSTGNTSSTPAQTDTFTYSPKGELLTAQVGTGSLISYLYDAGGRQVGRVQGIKTLQLYYGNPNSPDQLTASALQTLQRDGGLQHQGLCHQLHSLRMVFYSPLPATNELKLPK
jgi:hypothetical protein